MLVWLRSEEDHGAAPDLPGRQDGGGALGGGWTVAVVPLVVHVDAATVNLHIAVRQKLNINDINNNNIILIGCRMQASFLV